jgi:hypothetical protein
MKKLTATILGTVLVGALLTGCSDSNKCTDSEYPMTDGTCVNISEYNKTMFDNPDTYGTGTDTFDTSWVPEGFNVYTADSSIAWRWAKNNEFECDYGSCWGVMVVTRDGCSSMYSEINIFDRNDVQIDYTNEMTSTIQPMQKVLLSFNTYNDRADSASIAEFVCR